MANNTYPINQHFPHHRISGDSDELPLGPDDIPGEPQNKPIFSYTQKYAEKKARLERVVSRQIEQLTHFREEFLKVDLNLGQNRYFVHGGIFRHIVLDGRIPPDQDFLIDFDRFADDRDNILAAIGKVWGRNLNLITGINWINFKHENNDYTLKQHTPAEFSCTNSLDSLCMKVSFSMGQMKTDIVAKDEYDLDVALALAEQGRFYIRWEHINSPRERNGLFNYARYISLGYFLDSSYSNVPNNSVIENIFCNKFEADYREKSAAEIEGAIWRTVDSHFPLNTNVRYAIFYLLNLDQLLFHSHCSQNFKDMVRTIIARLILERILQIPLPAMIAPRCSAFARDKRNQLQKFEEANLLHVCRDWLVGKLFRKEFDDRGNRIVYFAHHQGGHLIKGGQYDPHHPLWKNNPRPQLIQNALHRLLTPAAAAAAAAAPVPAPVPVPEPLPPVPVPAPAPVPEPLPPPPPPQEPKPWVKLDWSQSIQERKPASSKPQAALVPVIVPPKPLPQKSEAERIIANVDFEKFLAAWDKKLKNQVDCEMCAEKLAQIIPENPLNFRTDKLEEIILFLLNELGKDDSWRAKLRINELVRAYFDATNRPITANRQEIANIAITYFYKTNTLDFARRLAKLVIEKSKGDSAKLVSFIHKLSKELIGDMKFLLELQEEVLKYPECNVTEVLQILRENGGHCIASLLKAVFARCQSESDKEAIDFIMRAWMRMFPAKSSELNPEIESTKNAPLRYFEFFRFLCSSPVNGPSMESKVIEGLNSLVKRRIIKAEQIEFMASWPALQHPKIKERFTKLVDEKITTLQKETAKEEIKADAPPVETPVAKELTRLGAFYSRVLAPKFPIDQPLKTIASAQAFIRYLQSMYEVEAEQVPFLKERLNDVYMHLSPNNVAGFSEDGVENLLKRWPMLASGLVKVLFKIAMLKNSPEDEVRINQANQAVIALYENRDHLSKAEFLEIWGFLIFFMAAKKSTIALIRDSFAHLIDQDAEQEKEGKPSYHADLLHIMHKNMMDQLHITRNKDLVTSIMEDIAPLYSVDYVENRAQHLFDLLSCLTQPSPTQGTVTHQDIETLFKLFMDTEEEEEYEQAQKKVIHAAPDKWFAINAYFKPIMAAPVVPVAQPVPASMQPGLGDIPRLFKEADAAYDCAQYKPCISLLKSVEAIVSKSEGVTPRDKDEMRFQYLHRLGNVYLTIGQNILAYNYFKETYSIYNNHLDIFALLLKSCYAVGRHMEGLDLYYKHANFREGLSWDNFHHLALAYGKEENWICAFVFACRAMLNAPAGAHLKFDKQVNEIMKILSHANDKLRKLKLSEKQKKILSEAYKAALNIGLGKPNKLKTPFKNFEESFSDLYKKGFEGRAKPAVERKEGEATISV